MAVSTVKPGLVIFDLDGTLGVLPVDWLELKKKVEVYFRAQTGSTESFSFWGGMKHLKEKLGPEELRQAYAIIQGYEHQGALQFLPNEFAVSYLKTVVIRGGTVAICSNNMTSTVTMVLDRLGVRPQVSLIVGMDSVTRPKPDPEGLLQILEKLKMAREETVFVGDTNTDREAARAASIRFVAVEHLNSEQG
jgi:HAD superfamily hydrolase (TIGR01509 family)